ncbi:MAG: helix-turn-helix domain-containing protein [Candidatus Methanosuratincola sp.]
MSFSDLRSIGLKDAEIRVYEHLVENGEDLLSSIPEKLGMGAEATKSAVEELASIGAVEVKSGRVTPIAPKAFLQRYMKKQEVECDLRISEIRATVSRLQSTLEPLYAEKRLGMRMEELLQVIDGLPAMELETVKIISRANEEVCILAEEFSWYDKVREELLSALERKVVVRVILLVKDGKVEQRVNDMKQNGVEVRFSGREWRNTRFTIVDSKELIFLIWARKSDSSRIYYRPGYTKNPGLVSTFHDSFDLLWERAVRL